MSVVCVAPKIRDLQNATILLHRPAAISFVIEFFGSVTIYVTHFTDNVQVDTIDVDISGSADVAIPLGNATYANDGCYQILVVSAKSSNAEGTVCLTVKG